MLCTACFSTNPVCRTCGGSGSTPDPIGPNRGVLRDPKKFGTHEYPLHASAIPELMKCSWKAAMIYYFEPEDGSNAAADTGSATHVAVSNWHKNKDIAAAVREMRDVSERKFGQADLTEAAAMFLLYTKDPRNQEAEIARGSDGQLLLEQHVSFSIKAAENDPTQEEIAVVGTIDQIRLRHGRPEVWDLKTSKKPGFDQLNMYLYQIAAYAIGASSLLGTRVRMGGLITPRHYKKENPPENSPVGVFWPYPHKFDDLEYLLNGLRHIVATIRLGGVYVSPGEQCRYCPARGTEECLPLLRSITDQGTMRISLKLV